MANPFPSIGISVFNKDTRQTFLETNGIFLGHDKKIHCLKKGDVVLLVDIDTKEVFGIGRLRAIDRDRIYREAHPYDKELYPSPYHKYNRYEVGVDTTRIPPTPFSAVLVASGLSENTPINRGHWTSYRRIKVNLWPWIQSMIE
jgi:hypothetical protein